MHLSCGGREVNAVEGLQPMIQSQVEAPPPTEQAVLAFGATKGEDGRKSQIKRYEQQLAEQKAGAARKATTVNGRRRLVAERYYGDQPLAGQAFGGMYGGLATQPG